MLNTRVWGWRKSFLDLSLGNVGVEWVPVLQESGLTIRIPSSHNALELGSMQAATTEQSRRGFCFGVTALRMVTHTPRNRTPRVL